MGKRIDPWGSNDIGDYQNLFREFGIEPFDKYRDIYPDNRYVRRGIIFGHRDFERINQSIQSKKPYAMMTGLMPSGRFHFGHKMVADQIIWYQGKGAEIFLCSADLEAYVVRGIALDEARKTAVEEYLTNYIALGLKEDMLSFWFQTDYEIPYYRLRDTLSRKVTLNELKAIYGSDLSTGKIFSAITQVADILHPQLKEYGSPRPTIVPVGADQDPHIRLTRDLASRFREEHGFIPPSATFHKFMQGLEGGKMSSSNPSSYIALTDEPKAAEKKIMRSKTGGRATMQEQKEKGGVPEDCMVYELMVYHLVDDDRELEEIYMDCTSGKLVCGNCKKMCANLLKEFLAEHRKKREEAKDVVQGILEKKK